MQRISLAWIVEAFAALDRLSNIEDGMAGAQPWKLMFDAQQKIEELYENSVYRQHLRVSPSKADELRKTLQELIVTVYSDDEHKLTDIEAWKARQAGEHFRLVLLSELATLPTFLVTPKDNYDIDRLIDLGTGLFPSDMLDKVPETEDDAMEASKCLAYERNTACGFHTFRIVESVLRRYWDKVSSAKKRPNPQTLGNIAGQLKINNFGEEKVWGCLKQMADLHRNPLAHPDVILTADEAIEILGIARSAITPMLGVLPDVLPTTGAPSGAKSP